jgi:hypothetical protein
VVRDAELLADQEGNAGAGPELGGETEFARRSLEPRKNLPLLVAVEFGRSSGVGHGVQGLIAPLSGGGNPATDTAVADTEDAGHLGDRRSFLDSLDGAFATPFEFRGASLRSHATRRHKSSQCDKISSSDHQAATRTLAA